jgi:hypothetical protein
VRAVNALVALYQPALWVTQVGDSQSRGSVNQWRP